MTITVGEIEWEQPEPVGTGRISGYWATFRSERTSGRALLIPSGGAFEFFNGRDLSVETGWRKLEELRLLPPQERAAMVPSTPPGNYLVTGVVEVVVLDEETGTPDRFEVAVGSAWFTLTADESGELSLKVGDWVSFRVVGLELWDEGR